MYEICGEKTNFSPLILHIFPIFSRPGNAIYVDKKSSAWQIFFHSIACQQASAVLVYKVWAVYLLAIIHIASGILLLVFSSEGGIQMGADLPDVDEMMAANVTLQVPVNVWLGPSAHELSSGGL